jgi:CubicO group peptidase (beta-lactamase class C family)
MLGLLGAAALTGGALVALPGIAQAAPGASARSLSTFEQFVAEQAAQDRFSGTVLLAHHGGPALIRSYGMADKARSLLNLTDTVFWLASITKTFTATAVAQLMEQGKLTLLDTVGTYLHGFPPEIANAVTIHQLLTHTSGVGRPALGSGRLPDWSSFGELMDGTLDLIRQTPLQFTPGSRWAYSNDGFFVLGAIIATVTGQSYFDYVREHVFRRAGMSATDFYSRTQVLADDRIARPYWTQPDGTRVDFAASPYAPFNAGPPGGAYSTVSDILAFARALGTGKLLNPAFAGLITGAKVAVPPTAQPSQAEFYGYGHEVCIFHNQLLHGHSGGGPGASNRLDVAPDLDWVAVILSNYDTPITAIVDRERRLVTA